MALEIQALRDLPPRIEQPELREQRKITQLHAHYLEKQKDSVMPIKTLFDGLAIISGVVFTILSGLSGIPAVLLGIGIGIAFAGCSRSYINLTDRFQINQKAADAILSPGFYQYAMRNPQQLASAANIVRAHKSFTGG